MRIRALELSASGDSEDFVDYAFAQDSVFNGKDNFDAAE